MRESLYSINHGNINDIKKKNFLDEVHENEESLR